MRGFVLWVSVAAAAAGVAACGTGTEASASSASSLAPSFYDDFNRTTGLGSSWRVASGAFITDGAAARGTASSSYAVWVGTPDPGSQVSITLSPPANTYVGVLVRANPTAPDRDHYAGYVGPDGRVAIARRDAWVYTYLATGPVLPAGGHVLSLTATGTSSVALSLSVDGTAVVSAVDSSANARGSGLAGMFDYSGASQPLDNFTVTPPSTGTDGGTDAGTDAGAPDAGAPDAGAPDAGAPDAGTPDGGTADAGTNIIVEENALPGDTGWQMTWPTSLDDLSGYLSTDSAIAGEAVTAYVHSSFTSQVGWALYRIGWYQGLGGRLIAQDQFTAVPQPACPKDSATGLVECNWSQSFSFQVQPGWVSGVYVVMLTRLDGPQYPLIFTIRDQRRAAVMVQQSVTTWQAYNSYGGESLHVTQLGLPQGHAVKVSFARPYADRYGYFDEYEADLVRWLESQGYDATYVTNLDFNRDPNLPLRAGVFLTAGHDEYWAAAERDALENARAAGISQGYLSGNTAFWQIRIEASPSGPYRRVVCYKDTSDPLYPAPQTTVLWREPPVNRPENSLLGIMYGWWHPLSVPLAIDAPDHWLFAGTGLQAGDTIGQIGSASDQVFGNGAMPAGTIRLGGHPLVDFFGNPGRHDFTFYTAPSGAMVFATGTVQWNWGLYAPGIADARVQKITDNFLRATGAVPATPRALPVTQNAWARADTTGASSGVTTIAGVPGTHGTADGVASIATFDRPGGIAVASDGTVYVADAASHRIRMIRNGVVSTLAGSTQGYADGAGTAARFDTPQGLAVAQDGSLLVADTGNSCIRQVTPSGVVTTYAGQCGYFGYADGPASSARFQPQAIAVGPSGAAYVADGWNHAVRKIASGQVTTLAAGPNFDDPTAIAIAADETAYVIDSSARTLKAVSPSGAVTIILGGVPPIPPYRLRDGNGGGFNDGPLSVAVGMPGHGIAVVGSTLYFSDAGNDRIRRIDLSTSQVTTFAGTGRARCEDGPGTQAAFVYPQGIAAAPGALFVADSCGAVRRVAVPEEANGGTDAGIPDAGTPDAGTPDAGTPDAGTPDAGTPDAGTNIIVQENALPGDPGWSIWWYVSVNDLSGYLSTDSAIAGETVTGYVNSSSTSQVGWALYRIGWYQGVGGRLITQGQFTGGPQPACPKDSATGLVECNWSPSFSFQVQPNWVSGVYVVMLTRPQGPQYPLIFTIRDQRHAAVMVQQSVTTWQAYNDYGGESLYVTQLGLPLWHAVKVSFDRPYQSQYGQFDEFETDLVRWLESQGYDATYVTNLDFNRDPNLPLRAGVFLSVGHDEYWAAAERDALENARAAGVSQGYLSANTGFWQIRTEPSSTGPYRRLVCYKDTSDPLYPAPQTTVNWRDPPVNRPENSLLGIMYSWWNPRDIPLAIDAPDHWLFAGTGLRAGDTIGQIVGYEVDQLFDNGATPAGTIRLGGHPVADVYGTPGKHDFTIYTAPSGAMVFATGTIEWNWGLYAPGVADARVQKITDNFLRATGAVPATPRALPVTQNAWARADTTGASSAVTTIAGVPGTHGAADGPASVATFDRPGGIAAASDGTVYVADAASHRIRMIRNGAVSTLAGSTQGYADGTGTAAQFNTPEGLAVAQDGSLLVADTGNSCIRQVTPSGVVTTYAGQCGSWYGYADGPASSAQFQPQAVAVGPSGAVYVADGWNHAVRKIASGQVTTLAGSADFTLPTAIAIAADETAYVVDSGARTLKAVRPSGAVTIVLAGIPASPPYILRTGIGGGFNDGPLSGAMGMPGHGIAVVGSSIYFSDAGNDRIRRIDLSSSRVTTFAGTGRARCEDGPGAQAAFVYPQGIAAAPGALFIADSCGAVRQIAVP